MNNPRVIIKRDIYDDDQQISKGCYGKLIDFEGCGYAKVILEDTLRKTVVVAIKHIEILA